MNLDSSIHKFFSQKTVRRIENTKTGASDRPVEDVIVKDCGALDVEEPFAVSKEPASDE